MERFRGTLHGIRPRVVLAYVALMAAALLVATVVVRQVLLTRMDASIESALVHEVEELRQLAEGNDPETGEAFADDVEALFDTFLRRNVPGDSESIYTLVAGEGFLTSAAPQASLLSDSELVERIDVVSEPERIDADTEAGEARLLVVPIRDDAGDQLGTFVVAFFIADERAEIERAVTLVGIVSIVVLGLSSMVAWGLAGRVLRPVAELSATATRITETDLSARIPAEGEDELARLGRTFNSMLDRLETAVLSQRAFLNDIAHDLRTPLTIVQGHLDMLSADPAERAATLELVDEELERMGRYVADLLVLAKAEQPDFLRVGLVDIGEWTADLLGRAQQLGDRSFVLVGAPDPGTAIAEADDERLTQAALNLLVNAVQHTEADDEIRIEARIDQATAHISISDSGPGIDPELLPDLFDRTTRGERSRTARREGTGLGLAIVRAIVEAHGGSVSAASEPGHGATFTMHIPLDPAGRVGLEEGA